MMIYSTIERMGFRIHYRPNSADESVLNESFEKDLFFRGVPEYRPQPDDIIIDVGAHIGCFTMLASGKVENGIVYSFEPSAETFDLLARNISVNEVTNTKIYQVAITEKDGVAELYHDLVTGNWGNTVVKAISNKSERVNCITLESFIISEKIPRVDFIKFNCEGAEFGILLNTSKQTLQKIKCMLVLYHGYLEQNYSRKQLHDYLSDAGFRIHYRYKNKDDDSGWMIAYRAGFWENVAINFRTMPLNFSFFTKKIRRKLRRAFQIMLGKE